MSTTVFRPTVSAVVTTYRRPQLARRAVESVLAQTYAPLQIIVVEDGSETGIQEWIERKHEDTVRYVRHDRNRGLAAARNTGLGLVTGEYTAFLDDDDEWLPVRLEQQVHLLSGLDPDELATTAVVYGGIRVVGPEGRLTVIRRPRNFGDLRAAILSAGLNTLSSTFLFSTRALRSVDGFDEELPSSIDHDIWMALAAAGWSVRAVDSPLVRTYAPNEGGRMTTDSDRRLVGVQEFLEKWRPTLVEWVGPREAERFIERYFATVGSAYAAEALWQGDLRQSWKAVHTVVQDASEKSFAVSKLMRKFVAGGLRRFAPGVLRLYLRSRNAVTSRRGDP